VGKTHQGGWYLDTGLTAKLQAHSRNMQADRRITSSQQRYRFQKNASLLHAACCSCCCCLMKGPVVGLPDTQLFMLPTSAGLI
jgi:hypothetical protein